MKYLRLLFMLCFCISLAASEALVKELKQHIGSERAFVVCLTDKDQSLPIALRAASQFYVHGLVKAEHKRGAREQIDKEGVYGDRLFVEAYPGSKRLSYPDYCANLIFVSESAQETSWDEIVRVLMPERGVLCVEGNNGAAQTLAALGLQPAGNKSIDGKTYAYFKRPRPAGMGDWNHDRRVNAANDRVLDADRIRGPFHTAWTNMGHSFSKFGIPVAAYGYTILRSGGILDKRKKSSTCTITAFNGYNGFQEWKVTLPEPDGIDLVVSEKHVFANAGTQLCAYHLKNGKEAWALKASDVDPKMTMWVKYAYANNALLVHLTEKKVDKIHKNSLPAESIVANLDPVTGKARWSKTLNPGPYQCLLADGKVFVAIPHTSLSAYAADSGEELWQIPMKHGVSKSKGLYLTNNYIVYNRVPYDASNGEQQKQDVLKQGGLYAFTHNKDATGVQTTIAKGDNKEVIGSVKVFRDPYDPKTGIPEGSWCYGRCIVRTETTHCKFFSSYGTMILDKLHARLYAAEGFRANCRTGVIAGNGMVYNSASGCSCSYAIKAGIALVPVSMDMYEGEKAPAQLQKGPAYKAAINGVATETDWPMYRRDNARTSGGPGSLQLPLQSAWSARLKGKLTPAAAVNDLVFIGSDAHRVYAIDASTGAIKWQKFTGGKVLVTPTYWQGRLFVGCEDGYVYSYKADDGQLIWRFRASPYDRRMLDFGELRSNWPVNGGVIIDEGILYFYAGLSSADKVYVYALDAKTADIKWVNNDAGFATTEENLRTGASPYGVSPKGIICASDDMLYVPQGQSVPAGFRKSDGKLMWWKRRGDSEQRSNIHMQWTGGPELSYADGWLYVGGAQNKKFNYFYAVNGKNGRALGQDFKHMFSNKNIGRDENGDVINPKKSLWGLRPQSFGGYTLIAPVYHKNNLFVWRHANGKVIIDIAAHISRIEQGIKADIDQPLELAFAGEHVVPMGDQVFVSSGKQLLVKELETGKELWKQILDKQPKIRTNGITLRQNQVILVTDANEVICWKSASAH